MTAPGGSYLILPEKGQNVFSGAVILYRISVAKLTYFFPCHHYTCHPGLVWLQCDYLYAQIALNPDIFQQRMSKISSVI